MAKARRKMRRALMKKMRKGALTPGERRDLMELDREVNRANRQAAGVGGAGLAAALAIASKTGALGKGKDALGDFLDERKKKKADAEAQELKEKEDQRKMEEEFGIRLAEGADRAEEADREEDRQNLLKRAEEAEKKEMAEEKARQAGFESVEDRERQREDFLKRQEASDRADVFGDPSDVDFSMPDGPTRGDFERLRTDKIDRPHSLVSGFDRDSRSFTYDTVPSSMTELEYLDKNSGDPTTSLRDGDDLVVEAALNQLDYTGGVGGDIDYSDLQQIRDRNLRRRQRESDKRDREAGVARGRQIAFDREFPAGAPLAPQAGPRAEEGREMPDPDRPVMTRQGMDLDTMIRLGGRGRSEGDRDAGPAADLSDYSPEEIEALIRYDLRQADGGTTPFLRKMRDRIRKKFR